MPVELSIKDDIDRAIRKTFPFHRDAERVTKARFQRHFNRRFRQALRTAR